MSLNLTLVPDCVDYSCIEVYGRCVDRHTKTQYIYVV